MFLNEECEIAPNPKNKATGPHDPNKAAISNLKILVRTPDKTTLELSFLNVFDLN